MPELPEIEFNLNSSGITIFCPLLNTPRFVPFDQKGRCPVCKSDNVEIDYILQPEGVTIMCSRFKKEKFVKFDVEEGSLRDIMNFRIKSRSKTYNFPLFENSKKLRDFPPRTSLPTENVTDIPLPIDPPSEIPPTSIIVD